MNGNHRTSGRQYVIWNYSQLCDAVFWLPLKFDSEGNIAEHRWHRKKEVGRDISYSIGWNNFQALGWLCSDVIYGCESWTIKKAECRRIDAFELWCWRRFWRVPWTARRSNQFILKKISPECSLDGLMLKLKLIWKDPVAGKDWRWEEKGMTEDEMVAWHHRLNGHESE